MLRITAISVLLLVGVPNVALAGGGCPEGYTPIDGICRPYRGPHVPYGYYDDGYNRYPRSGYYYRRYEPDPGAAIALGIIGATAGAIAHQRYYRNRHHRRYR